MNEKGIFEFYRDAKIFVENSDYADEPKIQANLNFDQVTAEQFLNEFCYVIFNTGMKNQIADKMYREFQAQNMNPDLINHELKKDAIIAGLNQHTLWFNELKSLKTDRDRVEFLFNLPFIGKITKYHLAKNIGIDCVKPDRHLIVLAKKFEFETPRGMCEYIQKVTGEKLRVIDVILWRYCNLNPHKVAMMKQDVLNGD